MISAFWSRIREFFTICEKFVKFSQWGNQRVIVLKTINWESKLYTGTVFRSKNIYRYLGCICSSHCEDFADFFQICENFTKFSQIPCQGGLSKVGRSRYFFEAAVCPLITIRNFSQVSTSQYQHRAILLRFVKISRNFHNTSVFENGMVRVGARSIESDPWAYQGSWYYSGPLPVGFLTKHRICENFVKISQCVYTRELEGTRWSQIDRKWSLSVPRQLVISGSASGWILDETSDLWKIREIFTMHLYSRTRGYVLDPDHM